MTQTTEAELVVSQEAEAFAEPFMGRMDGWYLGKQRYEDLLLQAFQRAMTQAADAAYLRGVEDAAKVADSSEEQCLVSASSYDFMDVQSQKCRARANEAQIIASTIRNLTSGERDG